MMTLTMMTRRRIGMTLVELLVVLGIVTVLAALVLPSVKTLLVDRKATQAATLVRNFLETARARAIGSGLPVAVVFERLSSTPSSVDGVFVTTAYGSGTRLVSATATDPWPTSPIPADANFLPYNASIRLSLAEQPLPVTDEMISTTAMKTIEAMAVGSAPATIRVEGMDYYRVAGGANNPVLKSLLVAGNEISFKLTGSRHMITQSETDSNNAVWFTTVSRDGVNGLLEQAIPSTEGLTPIGATTSNFTIYPKPRPINGPTVQLPKGMCVDLSLSGFATPGSAPSRDTRMRFSSEWLYARTAGPSAHELRPLYVVFTPDGGLSRVYTNGRDTGAASLIPVESTDDFFLHIGKIDQVVMPQMPGTPTAADNQNLTDPSGFVVRISPKTGSVSSAPAANVDTQMALRGVTPVTVGDVLELTRQNTFGFPVTGQ